LPRPFFLVSLLLAAAALSGTTRAACVGARVAPAVSGQPEPWRRAVEALARSTAEPGHPWSCAGGEIDLVASGAGALLIIRREGEAWITRPVGSPGDVLPLGEALLARPVGFEQPEPPAPAAPTEAPAAVAPAPAVAASGPRLLVGASVAADYAGRSRLGLIGPEIAAAVPLGSWLPQVSFRYQSSVGSRGPSIDAIGLGAALLRRWSIAGGELRVGGRLGAGLAVQDLPRPAGAQAHLDAHLGLLAAAVVPLWSSLRLVLAIEGERGLFSRTIGDLSVAAPHPFPSYLLGGSAGVELAL
jgi:hypothetical protein